VTKKRKSGSSFNGRIFFLYVLFFLFFLTVIGRVFYIQIYRGDFFSDLAYENRNSTIEISTRRGAIRDVNGDVLAVSAAVDTLYAEPSRIKNPEIVADILAPVLEMNRQDLLEKLTKKTSFIFIERKMDSDRVKELKKIRIDGKPIQELGLGFIIEQKRYYPLKEVAANVIGFSGLDGNGLEGLEFSYEETLSGKEGVIRGEKDPRGIVIPGTVTLDEGKEDGNDVYLTIDERVQSYAQEALREASGTYKIKSGTIIVLQPESGKILAMASYPEFDANRYVDATAEDRKNLAVSMIYEPGSTFKIVTAAAALEEKVVNNGEEFNCPGYINVKGGRIRCHDNRAHGKQSFAEIVVNSCNVGFVELGLNRLGKDNFFRYIRMFGFGQKSGIDLPGEEKGIMRAEKDTIPLELATISIGQGIAVTPIQIAMAAGAIANGGNLMKPQIIDKIVDAATGKLVKEIKPEVRQQVMSPENARQLRNILQQVVEEGTGKQAFAKNYSVGGKTGTAQKVSATGGYLKGNYVASFVGFAPVDKPRLVILVVIDEPQGAYYGGEVAAPIFLKVMTRSLEIIDYQPGIDLSLLAPIKNSDALDIQKLTMPDLVGIATSQAMEVLAGVGADYQLHGGGELITQTLPQPGGIINAGEKVTLIAGKTSKNRVMMPYLEGYSKRKALIILSELGLKPMASGTGICVSQDPPGGSGIDPGSAVWLTFSTE